jgi:hypothetical protein
MMMSLIFNSYCVSLSLAQELLVIPGFSCTFLTFVDSKFFFIGCWSFSHLLTQSFLYWLLINPFDCNYKRKERHWASSHNVTDQIEEQRNQKRDNLSKRERREIGGVQLKWIGTDQSFDSFEERSINWIVPGTIDWMRCLSYDQSVDLFKQQSNDWSIWDEIVACSAWR